MTRPPNIKNERDLKIYPAKNPFDDCFVYVKEGEEGSWDDVNPIMDHLRSEGLRTRYSFISPDGKLLISLFDRDNISKQKVDEIAGKRGYRPANK